MCNRKYFFNQIERKPLNTSYSSSIFYTQTTETKKMLVELILFFFKFNTKSP